VAYPLQNTQKRTSKYDIFSTTAMVGIPKDENISIPFFVSDKASLDGVVTATAPLSCKSWHTCSWMSPVPGGKSKIRTSNSCQSVPFKLQAKASRVSGRANEADQESNSENLQLLNHLPSHGTPHDCGSIVFSASRNAALAG
jgi:hypothetical protein